MSHGGLQWASETIHEPLQLKRTGSRPLLERQQQQPKETVLLDYLRYNQIVLISALTKDITKLEYINRYKLVLYG